jgi:plastocyanin
MSNMLKRISFLMLLSIGAVASAAGADPTPSPAPAPVAHVKIKDLAFSPNVLHVKAGTMVIWTNEDDVVHTVTSGKTADDNAFETSPGIAGGKTFSHTFTKPGTYPYYCKPHYYSEQMHGTIVVDP